MSAIQKLTKAFEVRLSFCQFSDSSVGVRQFLTTNYKEIKLVNPRLPLLLRECEGTTPMLAVRYAYGEERFEDLTHFSEVQVGAMLNEMAA